MKGFMLALLVLPCASHGAVYKCSTESDTYFSQIPCEENAEVVEFEETTLSGDSAQGAVAAPGQSEVTQTPERTAEDTMRDFVRTLQRQRLEQVEALDDQILALEAVMSESGGAETDESRRVQLSQQLSQLNSERDSIVEQYAALIEEAERRLEGQGLQ